MRIQIFSDLHLDVLPIKKISAVDGIDCVIVAGDTCEGVLSAFAHLRRIVPMPTPILMVLGNHEYYRRFIPDELALARSRAPSFNIHVLENDTIVHNGVRFVGATLWTDYRIFGDARQNWAMSACGAAMNDHGQIGWKKQPWARFRPQEAALLHYRSRSYVEYILATEFDGPTCVITHHAAHWDSILPKYQNDPVTAAFVSDMSATIKAHQPALWVHGHVHNSCDYYVGKTRIVCNPHGYGNENAGFSGSLVVQIDT
ncbi:metallophosphoesterase [Bradyrhizobium macuxiense]|uniref:Metallophosphoesterase n=1 Tax=Bradyrhizobium macuxiense TaxID=1755647 RepID=A0A109JG94_9BRAD|nr:metallophosphoesterase [Bradyrhizobium macuxiense]KWV48413.1 metallophosphoesterase [Bradyrhizobium macuxiense]